MEDLMMITLIKRQFLWIFVLSCSILGLFMDATDAKWTIISSRKTAVGGKEFNLTCNTGSLVDEISWYRYSERICKFSTDCVQDNRDNSQYKCFCTNMTSSTIVIPAVDINSEHMSVWQCSGLHRSNTFQIIVLQKPKENLNVTGYNGSILGLEQNLTVRCISYGGRPLADLSWTCGGKSLQGWNSNRTEESISEISLILNKRLSGQTCTCRATHQLWDTPLQKDSLPLQIYYASAEDPQVNGYNNLYGVREGKRINLTCTVHGGYPLPSLSWTCVNATINANEVIDRSKEGVAKIILPLFINRTLNSRQCFCKGKSDANYSRTSNVTLKVNYPPTVTLLYHKEQLPNGTENSIYCQVERGNPENYMISWSQTFANKVVRINTDLHKLQSNNGQNLTLIASSHNDIGLYTCSVHNNVTDVHGNLLQNKSFEIKRNFSALFTLAKNFVFYAVNGKQFDVKIPFYCQPAVYSTDDIMYYKEDNKGRRIVQKSNFTFDLFSTTVHIPFYNASVEVAGQLAVMKIKEVRNSFTGTYVLKIRNMEDAYSQFEFRIEVNDPQQQTDMSLLIGTSLAGFLCLVIVTVVIVCIVIKHKTRKDEVVCVYKEAAHTNKLKQRKRTNSDLYSEPWSGMFLRRNDSHRIVKQKETIHLTNEIPMAAITPYAATGVEPEFDSVPVNKNYADVTAEYQDIDQIDAIDLSESEDDEKTGFNYVEIDTSKTSSQIIRKFNSRRSEVVRAVA